MWQAIGKGRSYGAMGLSLWLALPVGGCSFPGSFQAMQADEIHAMSKLKDASAVCITGQGTISAHGTLVMVSIDKGIKGSLSVEKDCVVKVETK